MNILVVEDCEDDRHAAERFLTRFGCVVTCVTTLREAVKLDPTMRFDLILLDSRLEDADASVTAVWASAFVTPVVILTGHPEIFERYNQDGDLFIVSKDELASGLEQALARFRETAGTE